LGPEGRVVAPAWFSRLQIALRAARGLSAYYKRKLQFAGGASLQDQPSPGLLPRRKGHHRPLFEMEADSQTLADCDRRADEHFLMLDAMEAQDSQAQRR
jgi:hypothetical protein